MNGQHVDQKSVAVSAEDARIRLIDKEAVAYSPDISIGDITIADPGIWSLETGELMTITIAQNLERKFTDHGSIIQFHI